MKEKNQAGPEKTTFLSNQVKVVNLIDYRKQSWQKAV
jgi:NADPH-dependent curcumin reductase CurA